MKKKLETKREPSTRRKNYSSSKPEKRKSRQETSLNVTTIEDISGSKPIILPTKSHTHRPKATTSDIQYIQKPRPHTTRPKSRRGAQYTANIFDPGLTALLDNSDVGHSISPSFNLGVIHRAPPLKSAKSAFSEAGRALSLNSNVDEKDERPLIPPK